MLACFGQYRIVTRYEKFTEIISYTRTFCNSENIHLQS